LKTKPQVKKRLARMLISRMGVEGSLKAIEELSAVKALIGKCPELKRVLEGPQFSPEEKDTVIAHLAKAFSMSEGSAKYLDFLVKNGYINDLPEILDSALAIYMERMKKAKARVLSSISLGEKAEARLLTALRKLTGRDVEVDFVVDPSILGGVLVEAGSAMFDGSLRGQLRLLKEELIKG
jgi:ATP synthase F1 delta subunit